MAVVRQGNRVWGLLWAEAGLPREAAPAPVGFCWEQAELEKQNDGVTSGMMEGAAGHGHPSHHVLRSGTCLVYKNRAGHYCVHPRCCNLYRAWLGWKGTQKSTSKGKPGSNIQWTIYYIYILDEIILLQLFEDCFQLHCLLLKVRLDSSLIYFIHWILGWFLLEREAGLLVLSASTLSKCSQQ